jgi:hypothetical protein
MMLASRLLADKLPVYYRNSDETKDLMIQYKLKDELILGNEWHWAK